MKFDAAADGRKRSLSDDDKEDGSRCEKKRVSLVGKPRGIGREGPRSIGPESRMKKKWEIPSEVVVFQGVKKDGVAEISDVSDVQPKIRTVRCVNATPRGSGPAKRVVDLVGMKKYFSNSDEFYQKLVSLVGKPRGIGREGLRSIGPESRMKKKWEIPSEVVVFQGVEEDGVVEIGDESDVQSKIRTVRCVNDTPRGSGPAKRVVDLVGMKKYFSNSDEFCQQLSFTEEDGERE